MYNLADLALIQEGQREKHYLRHARMLDVWWDLWSQQYTDPWGIDVRFEPSTSRAKGLHASEVTGCPRKFGYSVHGTMMQYQHSRKMSRIFHFGHMIHAYIQQQMHLMCEWLNAPPQQNNKRINPDGITLTFDHEVRIHPGLGGTAAQYNVHSSSDGVFTFYMEQVAFMRVILEIKSLNPEEYKTKNASSDEHLDQVCVYQKCLDVPVSWVLYLNKSTLANKSSDNEFLSVFNPYRWSKLETRIQTALAELEFRGELPKEEGFQCSWCPYAWHCNPDYLRRYAKPTGSFGRR